MQEEFKKVSEHVQLCQGQQQASHLTIQREQASLTNLQERLSQYMKSLSPSAPQTQYQQQLQTSIQTLSTTIQLNRTQYMQVTQRIQALSKRYFELRGLLQQAGVNVGTPKSASGGPGSSRSSSNGSPAATNAAARRQSTGEAIAVAAGRVVSPGSEARKKHTVEYHARLVTEVDALPKFHKWYKVATYTPCLRSVPRTGGVGNQYERCHCIGWKPEPNPSRNTDSYPCANCGHAITDHGDLSRLSEASLSHRVQIVVKMEKTYYSSQRSTNAQESKNCREQVQNYKLMLRGVALQPPPTTSKENLTALARRVSTRAAVYETPTIAQGLQAFVLSGKVPLPKARQQEIVSLYCQLVDSWDMQPPAIHADRTLHLVDIDVYSTIYKVWQQHCVGRGAMKSVPGLKEPRPASIHKTFGGVWLRCVCKLMHRALLASFAAPRVAQLTDVPKDLPVFLTALEKEISDPTSTIWRLAPGAAAKPGQKRAATSAPSGSKPRPKRDRSKKGLAAAEAAREAKAAAAAAAAASKAAAAKAAGGKSSSSSKGSKSQSAASKGAGSSSGSAASSGKASSSKSSGHHASYPAVKPLAAVKPLVMSAPKPTVARLWGIRPGPGAATRKPLARSELPQANKPAPREETFKTAPSTTDASRDGRARRELSLGILDLAVLSNSVPPGSASAQPPDKDLLQLIQTKNLFARALPNMPKEYITRLVFCGKHKTLVLRKGDKIVGAVCFRPFFEQDFLEIVFCAVDSQEQVKGYGTYLMNNLKAYAVANECMHFLTYADNFAIGYFKKQGFTNEITQIQPRGYIKEYDGGQLMQCTLNRNLSYLNMSSVVHRQREEVLKQISDRASSRIRFKGLTAFDEGESFVAVKDIPGVLEAGWKADAPVLSVPEPTVDKATYTWMRAVHRDLKNHPSAWPFLEPVNREDAPDYFEVIVYPVDCKSIGAKLKSQAYKSKDEFVKEVTRMFDNCRRYNGETTQFYKCADDVQRWFRARLLHR